jgi:ribosomal protein L4
MVPPNTRGMAMRAALMEAANADLVVVDDVEIDEPGPGEVLEAVSH